MSWVSAFYRGATQGKEICASAALLVPATVVAQAVAEAAPEEGGSGGDVKTRSEPAAHHADKAHVFASNSARLRGKLDGDGRVRRVNGCRHPVDNEEVLLDVKANGNHIAVPLAPCEVAPVPGDQPTLPGKLLGVDGEALFYRLTRHLRGLTPPKHRLGALLCPMLHPSIRTKPPRVRQGTYGELAGVIRVGTAMMDLLRIRLCPKRPGLLHLVPSAPRRIGTPI